MSNYPLEDKLKSRKTPFFGAREKSFGKIHEIYTGAPCAWSAERGATHTLYLGETEGIYARPHTGTRPAKLLKTVLYVGTDEENDQIIWEKWKVQIVWRNEGK